MRAYEYEGEINIQIGRAGRFAWQTATLQMGSCRIMFRGLNVSEPLTIMICTNFNKLTWEQNELT